jgi:hypothetical protein
VTRLRILFLDIDGVLNSHNWWDRRPSPNLLLDPAAVGRLRRIIETTCCNVVISSTWRIGHTLPSIQRMLEANGLTDGLDRHIIGATPIIPELNVTGPRMGRGNEIDCWLRRVRPHSFAILDDDSDMGHHIDRLVQTSFTTGLLDSHVHRVIDMLTTEWNP